MSGSINLQVVYENGSADDDEDEKNIRFTLHRLVNSVNEIKEKVGGIITEPSSSLVSQQTTTTGHHLKRSSSHATIIGGGATGQLHHTFDEQHELRHRVSRDVFNPLRVSGSGP